MTAGCATARLRHCCREALGWRDWRRVLQPAIDLPSVPDVVNGHQLGVVIHTIDDPIVSHPDTI